MSRSGSDSDMDFIAGDDDGSVQDEKEQQKPVVGGKASAEPAESEKEFDESSNEEESEDEEVEVDLRSSPDSVTEDKDGNREPLQRTPQQTPQSKQQQQQPNAAGGGL